MKKYVLVFIGIIILYYFLFGVLKLNDGNPIFFINFRVSNLPHIQP